MKLLEVCDNMFRQLPAYRRDHVKILVDDFDRTFVFPGELRSFEVHLEEHTEYIYWRTACEVYDVILRQYNDMNWREDDPPTP